MTRLPLPLSLLLLVAHSALAQDDDVAFFEKKIRPVLVQHCYKCHSAQAKNVRGGLLLDTRMGIRKGGDSGPSVVPGSVDESLLIGSIKYEDYEMPPSGKLPDSIIADFEKWVSSGAPDPRDGKVTSHGTRMDIESGRKFWAFQKPREHAVPTTTDVDWATSDVDRFILSEIDKAGLIPAADTDRRTLIRRLYFDLIGLPPSPGAINAFLHDESDHAVESVVDELLASRHFGERWGRHWLDVARYSDSTGGGRSLLLKVAWRYRNYVIDALNDDIPFNDFIVEQIAGDLLTSQDNVVRARQLTATGFLALGPTNYENQDKRQLRMDVVDEQIDTIGRAFLGMTIGCARCHDHKFDPIPTTDYYAMAGIFRSTKTLIDGNVSNWITRPLPIDGESAPAPKELAALTAALNKSKKRVERLRALVPTMTLDDDKATLKGKWEDSTLVKGFVGKRYVFTTDPIATATYRFTPTKTGRHEIVVSYTPGLNRDAGVPVLITQDHAVLKTATVNQKQTPDGGYASLGTVDLAGGKEVTVVIHTKGTKEVVIADSVRLTYVGDDDSVQARGKLKQVQAEVVRLQSELNKHRDAVKNAQKVLSVEEEKTPADFNVCIRGSVRKLGQSVPRGVMSVASSGPVTIPKGQSGRLQLARWIASAENPLTARVAVNRVWHHLFGAGLVRTVDNFGVPGEKPTHPELLDHLARQFTRGGWSMKKLIRSIVLTRSYALSSRPTAEQAKVDPENRLFARQNLRRLEAEILRDSLYSLSGQLILDRANDTVRSGTKSEYGYKFTSSHRSVYLPVFRNRLHEMFSVFDFPDPNLSNGRRNVSTLSTQALYLMNSPLILEHSQKTAERLLARKELSNRELLQLLYESAVGREPTEAEASLAMTFVTQPDGDAAERWASVCQALIGSVDFRYVR